MNRVALLLLGLIAASQAAVLFTREAQVSGFVRETRADPRKVMPIRIALKQYNLDVLEARVLDAANPQSKNYGKWLTPTEVLDLIAPSEAVVASISKWLMANGAAQVDASGRDVIKAKASVRVIEHLFNTQMFNWRHEKSGKIQTRHANALHVPDEFAEHIEFVSGVSELYGPSHIRPKSRTINENTKRNDVSAGYLIPENLRYFYNLPKQFWVNSKSSVSVAEFQDDASFNPQDTTYFNQQMNENVKVNKIVGPYSPSSPDAESTLDVQYAFSLSLNATTWFWTVQGWMYEFSTDLFNAKTRPAVVSMSWGWPEPQQCQVGQCSGSSKDYVTRVNTEFMKITGTGVTLLAASGDQGAPGDSNPYCDSTPVISTIFPGASPWVTSVGATMVDSSQSSGGNVNFNAPACQSYPCATITAETVCTYPTALITSGGGFSNYVTRPSWQSAAVNKYLSSGVQFPTSSQFASGNRAFPDVAAHGHSYLISIGQQLEQVDGTSASSPVWAAVISLLNDVRLDAGKPLLGFVNPLLYQIAASNPNAFHDITSGNNLCTESCCASVGYYATTGYDAVTGLGSPNGGNLISYVKGMSN